MLGMTYETLSAVDRLKKRRRGDADCIVGDTPTQEEDEATVLNSVLNAAGSWPLTHDLLLLLCGGTLKMFEDGDGFLLSSYRGECCINRRANGMFYATTDDSRLSDVTATFEFDLPSVSELYAVFALLDMLPAANLPSKPPVMAASGTPTADQARPAVSDHETVWSTYLAKQMNGEAEHVCVDGSRIDILTSKRAWEVDWVHKWAESLAQAALYGSLTNMPRGVILLLGRERADLERTYSLRAMTVAKEFNVPILFVNTKTGETSCNMFYEALLDEQPVPA